MDDGENVDLFPERLVDDAVREAPENEPTDRAVYRGPEKGLLLQAANGGANHRQERVSQPAPPLVVEGDRPLYVPCRAGMVPSPLLHPRRAPIPANLPSSASSSTAPP